MIPDLFLLFRMFVNNDAMQPTLGISTWHLLEPFAFVLLITYYLYRRLTHKTFFNKKLKLGICLFIIISIFSFPLLFLYNLRYAQGANPSVEIYAVTSCLWGFETYLFFIIFFYDIFRVFFKLIKLPVGIIYRRKIKDGQHSDHKLISSTYKLNTIRSITIISAAFLLFIIGFCQAVSQPPFIKRTVDFRKTSGSHRQIRILQLTDLHLNPLLGESWLRKIVNNTKLAKPDIVVITGDFVDGKASYNKKYITFLKELTVPIFFISGNHEILWGLEEWCSAFNEAGITVLDDRRILLSIKSVRILLAGVSDRGGGAWKFKVSPYFSGLLKNAPESDLKVLLSHRPEILPLAAESGFNLVLSGHTHSGQTFPLNLFAGLFTSYPRGFYRQGRTVLFTSPGAGFVGPPLRLFVPKEVTILDIKL